jgi:hypothetical protein
MTRFLTASVFLLWGTTAFAQVDPLPVVRTPIANEDRDAAARKARQDGVHLMPAAELDALLARARGNLLGVKASARLVESRYHAEFNGQALMAGTAKWRVQSPAHNPGLLRCPQWNLAISEPRWQDNVQDRVLFGMLDGVDMGLWTDAVGEREFQFKWTARGTPTTQGMQFELRVPPAPIMLLEIRISPGYQLVLGKNSGMVTGPYAEGASPLLTWRIRATGRAQIDFVIRRISNENEPATLFAVADSRQTLTPDRLLTDFDFLLDVLHHPVRELTFSMTPGLKVFEVSCRQTEIKSWGVRDRDGAPSELALTLAEPIQGAATALRIRAFLPSAAVSADAWICPQIRLQRATQRSETVRLVVPADNPLQLWEPGDFRLIDTQDDQGTQTLTLVDSFPQEEVKRPRFAVKAPGVDLTTTQKTRWHVSPTESTVSTEVNYDLSRGQLLQLKLALRLPKVGNWQITGVKLMPGEMPLTWGLVESWLVVDLKKAINPRSDATLQVTLKGDWNLGDEVPRVVDFPELEPLDTQTRHGTVSVVVSPLFHASVVPGSMTGFQLDPGQDDQATFSFGYRNQRSSGQLRLVGLPAQYAARVHQTAVFRGEECLVNADITVEPLLGQPTFVDLWVPGRSDVYLRTTDGKESIVRALQRLSLPEVHQALATLSGGGPLGLASLHAMLPRGQHWRLSFREPLKKPATFELQCVRRLPPPLGSWLLCLQPPKHPYTLAASLAQIDPPDRQRWLAPLVALPRAERTAGEILLQPEDVSIAAVQGSGIDMPESAGVASGSETSRAFRYGSHPMIDFPRLWVTTQTKKAATQGSAAIDHARLASFVNEEGDVYHHLSWTLWNWRGREFSVVLPGGPMRILEVRLDGRSLDHWRLETTATGARLLLPLMVEAPADLPLHRLDVFYAPHEKQPLSIFLGRITAPAPEFPLRPIQMRHTWHLAPGLKPLHQEQMQSLFRASPGAWLGRSVWQAGSGLTEFFLGEREQSWRTKQTDLLKYAEREVRRAAADRPWLGHWVQALTFHAALETTPIVLDRESLRRRGFTPHRPIVLDGTRPFWEAAGLIYVPCPDGVLLTSPECAAKSEEAAFRRGLYQAVREAATSGQDHSGRFCAADFWLRSESPNSDGVDHLPPFLNAALEQGWSSWEWLPGRPTDDLPVVLVLPVRWFALSAAALLVLIGLWLLAGRARLTMRLALVLTVVGWLAGNLGPASLRELFVWPMLGMLFLLVVCYATYRPALALSPSAPRPGQSTHKVPKAALASILLGVCWLVPSQGQAPATIDVQVLPGDDAAPELALLPPELEASLKSLVEAKPAGFDDAVFLKARYKTSWHGTYARVAADFDVYCFKPQTRLLVPLVDAQLDAGSTLDGERVYPVLPPGPKPAGYLVNVEGAGLHRLKLAFLLQPQTTGEFSELRCGIPAAPEASLEGSFPQNWLSPSVVTCFGEASYRKSDKGAFWDVQADLGPQNALRIRWRSDAAPGKAQIEVRESYFVDLRPGSANLSAWLRYATVKGVAESVQLVLQDTEVRKVEWSLDGRSFAPVATWRTLPRGEAKLLIVELPEPTSGSFQLMVEMTPRLHAAGKLDVSLPLPLAALRGSWFGYRSEGLETTLTTVQLADTRIKADEFAWSKKLEGALTVFSFGRKAPQAALRFDLQAPAPQVTLTTQWSVQPPYADVRAETTWTSTDPFSLVQLEVPTAITLTDIQGSKAQDVHHWSRTKNVVQVWLSKPVKHVSLNALGWMKLPLLKEKRFQAPPFVPLQARLVSATALVQAAAQYELLPLSRKDKSTRVTEDTPLRRTYELTTARIPVEVGFERRPTPPHWQAHTHVDAREGVSTWHISLTGYHPLGQFSNATLVLRDWPFRFQARVGEPLAVRGYQRKGDDHFWTLDTRPGIGPSRVALKLQGRWPKNSLAPLRVPVVEIQQSGRIAHTLKLEGCELAEASRSAFEFHEEQGQEVLIWKDPSTRVEVRPLAPAGPAPVEVLYAEQSTFLAPPEQWGQRIDWLLSTQENPEVPIVMPADAQVTRLVVNERPVTPLLTAPNRLLVPMPAESLCQVRLEWRFPAEKQPLTRPSIATPKIEGVPNFVVHQVLLLPAGLEPVEEKNGEGMAPLLLAQARALLRSDTGASPRQLKSGERALRHARYRTVLAGQKADEIDKLIVESKASTPVLAVDAFASASELSALKAPLPRMHDVHAGRLVIWSQASQGSASSWELREVSAPLPLLARGPREIVTLFLLGILLVSLLPGGLRWLTALWPEQLAFAALVGVAMGGFTLLAAVLLGIALLSRVVIAVRWLYAALTLWWRGKDDGPVSSVHFQGSSHS